MAAPTISVCYIVRNEETFLDESLKSVKLLANEIILVDSGSTDSTTEIAKRWNARVEFFKWVDDFSKARNFAASFAKSDWILFVDGDEILETSGKDKILKMIQENPNVHAHGVLQRNYTSERSYPGWKPIDSLQYGEVSPLAGSVAGFVDNLMMKLYRNHLGIQWEGVVHETVVGSCKKLGLKHLEAPACILHHLNELKDKEFLKEKQLYYLKLALEKLKSDPQHENPWFEVAISLNNLGRFEEAERAFKEALLRRPDWDEAKLFRARTLLHLKRDVEAEPLLREVLQNPNFAAEASGHLSTALLYQGKFVECEKLLDESLRAHRGNLSLHVNAGTLYFEKGQYEKSREHILEALKITPEDPFLKGALEKTNSALKTG